MKQMHIRRASRDRLIVSEAPQPQLLTIPEVASILAIAENTLRNRQFRDKLGLTVIRVGRSIRFRQDEITEFIRKNAESQ